MSTTREIHIEDRHGVTLSVTMDEGGIINADISPPDMSVELDENDRRELGDFLNGAR